MVDPWSFRAAFQLTCRQARDRFSRFLELKRVGIGALLLVKTKVEQLPTLIDERPALNFPGLPAWTCQGKATLGWAMAARQKTIL